MHLQNSTNNVLGIIEPTVLQIDLNNNGVADEDETICIPDIQTFTIDITKQAPDFAKDFNLTQQEIIKLGYLTDEYANNLIYLKPVKVKFTGQTIPECRFAEIYTDGDKYSDKLVLSGFAARNNKFEKEKFLKNLEQARKLKLVILNHKSYKYHKLDCEYGLQSSDYVVIPQKQLPIDAKPCKFCHVNKQDITQTNKNTTQKTVFFISEGSIKLILTDLTTKLIPDRQCNNTACKALLTEINKAKKSIDIAAYGWDNIPLIHNSLIQAKQRGVKLRVVYDRSSNPNKEYYKETVSLLSIADKALSDYVEGNPAQSDKLMHNKFAIFDNKTVFTGSMNFSSTGLSGYNSNAILIINSEDVAKLYTAEFEQMLSGKFHNLKTKPNQPNSFQIDDSKISIYFSPYDKAMQFVVPIIDQAKNYIYLPTFLITHKDLTDALIKAKHRGVDVKIIIDANNTSTRNTKHALLRQNSILLKTENYAGKMHSKSIIIDDKYIITGSMNFSNSGENKNDENLIIIENTKLTKFYKEFFLYLWAKIPDKWLTRNARAEGKDSIGSCEDGIDNNFDGKIDSADAGCLH